MSRYGFRLATALALAALCVRPVMADDIVTTWSSEQLPPAPAVSPVKLDAKTTALLLLDFTKDVCNPSKLPRCAATLPAMVQLAKQARAANVLVIYSTGPTPASVTDLSKLVVSKLAPAPGDPIVRAQADKFIGTDLQKILKAKNIKTLIITGRVGPGAVLYTTSDATFKGFEVVVPVDGMSSADAFTDLATAWILSHSTVSVSKHVTLTRANMISF